MRRRESRMSATQIQATPEMGSPSKPDYARLGTGEQGDRLGFRLVLSLLVRCVGMLRPVRWHVVTLAVAYALVGAVVIGAVIILFDLFWTRALEGEPLTLATASSLGLDPGLVVNVETLSAEMRREIARQAMWLALFVFGPTMPLGILLWYYQVWILQRVNQVLRVDLLDRLQSLSLRFHAENRVGDAMYRVFQDSAMVTQLIDVLFLTPVFAVLRFVFLSVILIAFDPILALVLVCVWPPALVLGAFYSRRLRIGFRAAREANAGLTAHIQETLVGIKVIKAYGAEGREQVRFEQDSQDAFIAAYSARTLLASFGVLTFWVVGAGFLLATTMATINTRQQVQLLAGTSLAVAGLQVWNLGLYNSFKYLFGSGTDQVRVLFRTWGRTQDIAIGLERVFELLDLEPEIFDRPNATRLPPVERGVVFRHVEFRYRQDRPVLENIDFEARRGTVTAIVGPTGSGKSTLVALLLRLFDPDSGSIEIDGHDLRDLTVTSLRSRVSIALQENVLFAQTVRENIRYAVPEASDEAVVEAARVACAGDFISDLPEGYDTLLGERGAKLSSGQRQRLSIARAVLKSADILVLDEPTASLDAETELALLNNLAVWGRERIILQVTHRLATIQKADQIVVIEAGRVVESGSHADLMEGDGVYRRLVLAEKMSSRGEAA
ncbi:MAG TPA: ABC transporter ATP-binding protein [Myxococcales bacterium]|nr:ABC transporter ATP-binding protein [Myxococcales bacterium]